MMKTKRIKLTCDKVSLCTVVLLSIIVVILSKVLVMKWNDMVWTIAIVAATIQYLSHYCGGGGGDCGSSGSILLSLDRKWL